MKITLAVAKPVQTDIKKLLVQLGAPTLAGFVKSGVLYYDCSWYDSKEDLERRVLIGMRVGKQGFVLYDVAVQEDEYNSSNVSGNTDLSNSPAEYQKLPVAAALLSALKSDMRAGAGRGLISHLDYVQKAYRSRAKAASKRVDLLVMSELLTLLKNAQKSRP